MGAFGGGLAAALQKRMAPAPAAPAAPAPPSPLAQALAASMGPRATPAPAPMGPAPATRPQQVQPPVAPAPAPAAVPVHPNLLSSLAPAPTHAAPTAPVYAKTAAPAPTSAAPSVPAAGGSGWAGAMAPAIQSQMQTAAGMTPQQLAAAQLQARAANFTPQAATVIDPNTLGGPAAVGGDTHGNSYVTSNTLGSGLASTLVNQLPNGIPPPAPASAPPSAPPGSGGAVGPSAGPAATPTQAAPPAAAVTQSPATTVTPGQGGAASNNPLTVPDNVASIPVLGGVAQFAAGLANMAAPANDFQAQAPQYAAPQLNPDNFQMGNANQQAYGAKAGVAGSQAAPTLNTAALNPISAQQTGLANALLAQASGQGGPSAADLQAKQGTEAAIRAAQAQAASLGGNTGLLTRQLMDNESNTIAQGNQNAAILRAQESQAAQQAAGSVLGTQANQALQVAGQNTQAALQQQGMNNQMVQMYTQAGMSLDQAQLQAAMDQAHLGQQGMLATDQTNAGNWNAAQAINAQTAQANASRFTPIIGGLTSGIAGAVASKI